MLLLLLGLRLALTGRWVEHRAQQSRSDRGGTQHADDDFALHPGRDEQLAGAGIGLHGGGGRAEINHRHVTAQGLVEVDHHAVKLGGQATDAHQAGRRQVSIAGKIGSRVGEVGVEHEYQADVEVVDRQADCAFIAKDSVDTILVGRVGLPIPTHADKPKHIRHANGDRRDFTLGAVGEGNHFGAALGEGHGARHLQDAGDVADEVFDLGLDDVFVEVEQNRLVRVASGHQQAGLRAGAEHGLANGRQVEAGQQRRQIAAQNALDGLQGVEHTRQGIKGQRGYFRQGNIQRRELQITQQARRVKAALREVDIRHGQHQRQRPQPGNQARVDIHFNLFKACFKYLLHTHQPGHAHIGTQSQVLGQRTGDAIYFDTGKATGGHQCQRQINVLNRQTNEPVGARRADAGITTQPRRANGHDVNVVVQRIEPEVTEDAGFHPHQFLTLALGKGHGTFEVQKLHHRDLGVLHAGCNLNAVAVIDKDRRATERGELTSLSAVGLLEVDERTAIGCTVHRHIDVVQCGTKDWVHTHQACLVDLQAERIDGVAAVLILAESEINPASIDADRSVRVTNPEVRIANANERVEIGADEVERVKIIGPWQQVAARHGATQDDVIFAAEAEAQVAAEVSKVVDDKAGTAHVDREGLATAAVDVEHQGARPSGAAADAAHVATQAERNRQRLGAVIDCAAIAGGVDD